MALAAPPRAPMQKLQYKPYDFKLWAGLDVPDPITFVVGDKWLNRPNLYPRQATLLKVIFLREDLFTEYDYEVVAEWEQSFREHENNGITPDILKRMAILRERGYKWFREVLLVLGRRAGKGYVSALAMSYVLWNYMALGDPQEHYGVDRDKQLSCMIYAGKKEQARANLWQDLANVVLGAPCFEPYVPNRPLKETLEVFAPNDFVRLKKLLDRGIQPSSEMASFALVPKEATTMAGRGPASFMQGYDEFAHMVSAGGASRSGEEVYCLDPMTRVLCSDLIWRPIADLQPGDQLVGFDEFAEPGKQRKLREATVEHKWSTWGKALRIHFEDGSSVVCSPSHRWFKVDEGCNNGKWTTAGKVERQGSAGNPRPLQVGDRIRHLVDPWETDDSRDGGYLAGILDGEGWVSSPKTSGYKVGIAQNPGVVLDRTTELLKQFGFEYCQWNKHESRQNDCEQIEVRGLADTLRLLGQFRPERLGAKSKGLWEGKAPRGTSKFKVITEIEELPEQELVDIQTSTSTFIAEGLISHNSAATPSLDQFKKDAFIIEPSSPWQMIGQFYQNWENAQKVDDNGDPEYPTIMFLQLASWEIYYDWEDAHELPLFPDDFLGDLGEYEDRPHPQLNRLKGAIQTFDDEMRKLEAANPETFAVERRSHWQAVVDAYLDPHKVEAIFGPWNGRTLEFRTSGVLSAFYKGHADPSRANANFGIAIAHPEYDEERRLHCVFDFVGFWKPSDFEDNVVDYVEIEEQIWELVQGFKPDEFTFDQWNSAAVIDRLRMKVRRANFPKHVDVHEKTATAAHNWERAEAFKTAINQGWVHSPFLQQAEDELKFLQLISTATTMRVEKQDSGPVTTKDVADCLMECVWTILGEQVKTYTGGALAALPVSGAMAGGGDPYSRERAPGTYADGLGGFQRSVARRNPMGAAGRTNPARSALSRGPRRRIR